MNNERRPDPSDVHRRFALIERVLQTSATQRWRLQAVARLLPPPPRPGAESYLLELSDALSNAVARLDPVGWTPDVPAELARRLTEWSNAYPPLQNLDAWQYAVAGLRSAAARLYLYAGDLTTAFSVVDPDGTAHPDPSPRDRGLSPKQRLVQALQSNDLPDVVADVWSDALTHWEPHPRTATLPVVESHPTGAVHLDADTSPSAGDSGDGASGLNAADDPSLPTAPQVGGLLSMSVSLISGRVDPGVSIHALSLISPAPMRAIRSYVEYTYPGCVENGFVAIFDLANDRDRDALCQIQGKSGELAMTSLLLSSLTTACSRSEPWLLRNGTVWTGQVDKEGRVRAVADDTLETKVRSVFFSPAKRLVVPSAQYEATQAALDAVSDTYPHRRLTIIPVRHMSDVERNRALIDVQPHSWITDLAETVRRRWIPFTVIALLGALLLLLVMTGSLLSSTPSGIYQRGSELIVENDAGRVLDRIDLNGPVLSGADPSRYSAYALADVDDDGTIDTCWADWENRSTHPRCVLRCKHVGDNELFWETPITVIGDFPGQQIDPTAYVPHSLLVDDLDSAEGPEIYLTVNHDVAFPGAVLKLDASTGALQSRYLHPGPFHAPLRAIDADADGRRELMTGGVSTVYGDAFAVALSPDSVQGYGPAPAEYRPVQHDGSYERAYLRVPPPDVAQTSSSFPPVVRDVRKEDGGFRILQGHAYARSGSPNTTGPDVLVRFNNAFTPVDARVSRGFDQARQVERMRGDSIATGPSPTDPLNEFAAVLPSLIQRWTGTGWAPAAKRDSQRER